MIPNREPNTYIRTATGHKCYPCNPQPEDIRIEDIAHALSKMCRFNGHTREFYSVAQHSVLVSHMVPLELALCGLLHDASEAYIADICRPVKPFLADYYEIEERLMNVIAKVFNFPWPPPPEIKTADNRLLVTEQRDLMPQTDLHCTTAGSLPIAETIEPWAPETARVNFLQRYRELTNHA